MTRRGPRKGTGTPASEPRFLVRARHKVKATVRDASTPKAVKVAFADKYEALTREGCEAANYRLSGSGEWPKFCVVTMPERFRLLLVFPALDEIVLLELSKHDNRNDPYVTLAELLDLPSNEGHGGGRANRVSCCNDDGDPPVAETFLGLLDSML